jgi:hypothetical protein
MFINENEAVLNERAFDTITFLSPVGDEDDQAEGDWDDEEDEDFDDHAEDRNDLHEILLDNDIFDPDDDDHLPDDDLE